MNLTLMAQRSGFSSSRSRFLAFAPNRCHSLSTLCLKSLLLMFLVAFLFGPVATARQSVIIQGAIEEKNEMID